MLTDGVQCTLLFVLAYYLMLPISDYLTKFTILTTLFTNSIRISYDISSYHGHSINPSSLPTSVDGDESEVGLWQRLSIFIARSFNWVWVVVAILRWRRFRGGGFFLGGAEGLESPGPSVSLEKDQCLRVEESEEESMCSSRSGKSERLLGAVSTV